MVARVFCIRFETSALCSIADMDSQLCAWSKLPAEYEYFKVLQIKFYSDQARQWNKMKKPNFHYTSNCTKKTSLEKTSFVFLIKCNFCIFIFHIHIKCVTSHDAIISLNRLVFRIHITTNYGTYWLLESKSDPVFDDILRR